MMAVSPENANMDDAVADDLDLDQLRNFGTLLSDEAQGGRLPRAHGMDAICDAVDAALTGNAPRAAVLIGESGCGKTAVVHELAHRLLHDPSGPRHILRVSPAEFLVGTRYIGEWETKVHNLVQAVKQPRRVILFVPNLEELSEVGTTSKSDHNVATALAPHIERGDIVILGETTPERFRTGLGSIGSLRRLFHAIDVPATGPKETMAILRAVRDEAGADIPDAVLDRITELAGYYLAGTAQPGRTVGLLRRVLGTRGDRTGPITDRDVLTTLSTSTGIPVDFLDDEIPLDRSNVRAFFEARVMGQPEAVDAVVDMVTLVKAGLTDPGKPFGIFLFVGPTGVGKTELARSLAELLFGDPSRLVRFDMSEFATYDAHERLIGRQGSKSGLLTEAVRERPFAVLLFDEVEKAHGNVFDLCLQIFDAGRLTDTQGRTADFRRTIIILTSNIGSRIEEAAPVGFGRGSKPPPDRDATLRELGRWFRPEFLNRLDRIVTFRPLDAETAARIARREVSRVLVRSGITRRQLAVEVEPNVLSLLLKEGYSLTFGARPLKRTVERLVLLPVARAIASAGVSPGSMLRLVARGGRVDVEVTPPVAEESDSDRRDATPREVPTPGPLHQRVEKLAERVAALRAQAEPLAARKAELLARSVAPGFWDDRAAARAVLDEIYRLDNIFQTLDHLDEAARELQESAKRPRTTEADLTRLSDRLDTLESQAGHVGFLLSCDDRQKLGDAFVTLRLVAAHGPGLDAMGRLARMYMALARRRGMEVEVLDDRQGGDPREDAITLLISGAGAFALLAGEAGLHQFLRGKGKTREGRRRTPEREAVRVEVLAVPAADGDFQRDEIKVQTAPLRSVQGRVMAHPKLDVQLLHVPTLFSIRAWTDGSKAEAVERLRPLLCARVEAARAEPACATQAPVVRRYTLGPAPRVRDLRSGRATGRLDQVLDGHLEQFLTLPPAQAAGGSL
jgi:ATP-dependent Clp protease ATP-binding subunit ClpC